MTPVNLPELWLPILAAGLAAHVLSTLAWTVLPHHRAEWRQLPLEEEMEGAIKSSGVQIGGQYVLTDSTMPKSDPASGRGTLIVWDHQPNMGVNIGLTLAFFLFVATTIGYLAGIALPKETATIDVFRFTATAALLPYAFGGAPHVIWFRRKFLRDFLDGVAYSLATGAAFALLWPK